MPVHRTCAAALLLALLGLLACCASAIAEAPAKADATELPLRLPPRRPLVTEERATCGSHTVEARAACERVVGVSSVLRLPRDH